jgi:UDP-2,3-diacylglucosamine pyrophosphatase LpxH
MYEDKIKFNADAQKYKRTDKYHENSALLSLLSMLATRREQRRNIQRKNIETNFSKNKVKYDEKEDLKFIQNVK